MWAYAEIWEVMRKRLAQQTSAMQKRAEGADPKGLKVGADGEVLVVVHVLRVRNKGLQRDLEVRVRVHHTLQLLDCAVTVSAWAACPSGMQVHATSLWDPEIGA